MLGITLPSCRPPCRQAWSSSAVAALALLFASVAVAGPSVGELLAVCERGLRHGGTGVDAASCEWFAVPCECKATRADPGAPRWCLPPDEALDLAVRKVVAALRGRDPIQPAAPVVEDIMADLYPCAQAPHEP